MSERKKIDRLFQEKFKDFEVNPSEEVWGNIEAKLDQKKKRRIIPFWWKLSGVAALFLIGFSISKSIYNPKIKIENPVVKETKQTIKSDLNKKDLNNKSVQDAVVITSDEVKSNTVSNKKPGYSSKSVVSEIVSYDNRSLKKEFDSEKNNTVAAEAIAQKTQRKIIQKTKSNKLKTEKNQDFNNQEKQIAQINSKEDKNKKVSTTISNPANVGEAINKENINLDDLKGSVNSKIATKETEKTVNDTASKKSVANNELEELLNEKESKVKQESKRNRWQLTSNVAPIFLGSVSNGSPIDSTLSKNSKSYNTNVGFGIGLSYEVNKKLKVRTGLNKVNISYNTNDISFFTGIQSRMLTNVSPTASSSMINVLSNAVNNPPISETGLLPFENALAHENSGYLKQEIGYLEMPLEMTYSLFDKKFGLKIIGGFSTLFLQDNSITIISDNRNVLLGKANNLNDIHFSTNLGLGVKYGFLKSFEFNLEPTIKYQLNTFSSNSGNFKPYIFGVYSGISYKF